MPYESPPLLFEPHCGKGRRDKQGRGKRKPNAQKQAEKPNQPSAEETAASSNSAAEGEAPKKPRRNKRRYYHHKKASDSGKTQE